jgi:putative GTP pyrophosphokinase
MPLALRLSRAKEFLEQYRLEYPLVDEGARQLERFLNDCLRGQPVLLHAVTSRAKSFESTEGKLLRKQYTHPGRRVQDQIGARIILYHASDVSRVADFIKQFLEVREKDSSDKSYSLGLREFGYRSYHIVAKLPTRVCAEHNLPALLGRTFEIQLRSLLEHVWAEIEHEVVYKSGAVFPELLKRRFAAIAGVLELLEHEMQQLTFEKLRLVEAAKQKIARGDLLAPLDAPALIALLEIRQPNGIGFRSAISQFPPGIENRLILALTSLGLEDADDFDRALSTVSVRRALSRYARAEGIGAEELSHLAMTAVVIGMRNRRVLEVYFADLAADPSMKLALTRARRR